MKQFAHLLAALFLASLLSVAPEAHAQLSNGLVVATCGNQTLSAGTTRNLTLDPSGKMCIGGTISATATFTGFTPTGNATLTTSGTTARVALPSADTTALVRNTGAVDEWIAFGNGSVVATTGGTLVPAGQAIAFQIPVGATNIAGITGGSAGAIAVSTGTGTPTMTGGGSGGSGGGGAITAASSSYAAGAFSAGAGVDGWNLTQGAKADTACATDNGTCSIVALVKRTNQNVTTLNATAGSAIPAGTNIIGSVGLDQTTAGTTNGVVAKAAAVGGSTPGFTASLSTTVTAIKASAGSLYMLRCYNPNATVAYVQVFNVAFGSVTLGTTTPTQAYAIAATSPGGFASAIPVAFSTAMSYAATTTATGSTAPGTALSCNFAYN